MREKVFQTIYNLIQRGAISAEDAYYIIEAIFEKNNYVYNPSTWTTTSPQINTPDRGITDFWKQSTSGVPNITFTASSASNDNATYTTATHSINCIDNVTTTADTTENRIECLYGTVND